MRQIEETKGDDKVAQSLAKAWAEEDRAQEEAMMKRALEESKRMAERNANEIDEMYHPDQGPKVTKDGFYLKDSDDSDAENQAYSSSEDEDSEEEIIRVNTGKNQHRQK